MARSPLILRIARDVAGRALVVASRVKRVKAASVRTPYPLPLGLALRVGESIVGTLEERPPVATPAQQVVLGVAAAHLRAAAGAILLSTTDGRPDSVEASLGQLVFRTLALVDHAMTRQPGLPFRAAMLVEALQAPEPPA